MLDLAWSLLGDDGASANKLKVQTDPDVNTQRCSRSSPQMGEIKLKAKYYTSTIATTTIYSKKRRNGPVKKELGLYVKKEIKVNRKS